ncbi:hypothetical protein E4U42_002071 [Claviceps africana]|uniref:VOC domain-containing protein n=1 Tax=Claviceps africana TaxID=83212 RepID=A0A8K0JCU4_9HYPO|nr:hypothetical protein E4U42_002071 [Claviceps africana]
MPSAIISAPIPSPRTAQGAVNAYSKPKDVNANFENVPPYRVIDGCCVWHWTDKLSPAEGWIVIDSPVPTAAGGGLFLHQGATLREVRDVARSMSAKLAVSSQPQIVGAKGGIRFPPRDSRAASVLERFIRDNAAVLSKFWGTGGDINTDHAVIDQHARTYCAPGTSTALDALRIALGCVGSSPSDVPILLQERLDGVGWSLEEFCVGHVMAVTLKELLLHTDPKLIGRVRLAIQGFGCVGATFAHAVAQLGLGRVVAISSQYGFLVDDAGIDCDAIEGARRLAIKNHRSLEFDPRSLEAGLGPRQLRSERYTTRRAESSDEEHLSAFLAASRADVFVPCAQRYVLTPDVINTLVRDTFAGTAPGARFILAGANNVFSSAYGEERMLDELDSGSVRMLPEWVSNSGTANLFMRACSGLALKGHGKSNLEASSNDTKYFIKAALAKSGVKNGTKAMWEACRDLAAARRETGAVNLLGVQRMSHVTLNTTKYERAVETLTRVYNAKSNKDGSLFLLPALDDPTVSVVEAPAGTSPAHLGLSARFSVYNLDRAREVLKSEKVSFEERTLRDGTLELVLTREETGYPMSLVQTPKQELDRTAFTSSPAALRSVAGKGARHVDHFASIMPETHKIKAFHERMLGFAHVRTFTVNAGSAAEGEDDGLMHVMGLPYDDKRVNILTEGLNADSIFSKLLARSGGSYMHHIALKVGDVDAVFSEVRERGWETTSDKLSLDLATGLRQFFIKEDEAGCILELIGHGKVSDGETASADGEAEAVSESEEAQGGYSAEGEGGYSGQGDFRTGNIIELAQSLQSMTKDV